MQTDDSILRRELLSICITKKEKKRNYNIKTHN